MAVPQYFFSQAGAIPYRKTESGLEILLITSKKKGNWIFPKGVIENGDLQNSIVAELLEEAGVIGKPDLSKKWTYSVKKWNGVCTVDLYFVEITEILEEWNESSFRKRKWFTVEKAFAVVKSSGLKKIIMDIKKEKL